MKKLIAKYQIHDTFIITGRGIVLAGNIKEGIIHIGNLIRIEFNGGILERKIIGIEGVDGANEKLNIGIRIENVNEKETLDLSNWNPNLFIADIYETNNGSEIPLKVGGANLIEYLKLNEDHKWTGKTEHFVLGKLVKDFYGLAICKYDSSND
uniref:hypothetical protein n=2 Tax=Flavobacteriaceae TaxID=49546 RepID=UPI00404B2838